MARLGLEPSIPGFAVRLAADCDVCLCLYQRQNVRPYEPHHEKTCFSHMRTTKVQISLCSLISTFVVHCLDIILNPKFPDSSLSLWLSRLVWVYSGRKPRRQVFSWQGSYMPSIPKMGHRQHQMLHNLHCLLTVISIRNKKNEVHQTTLRLPFDEDGKVHWAKKRLGLYTRSWEQELFGIDLRSG